MKSVFSYENNKYLKRVKRHVLSRRVFPWNPECYFRQPRSNFLSKKHEVELTNKEKEYIHGKVICTTTGLQEGEIASPNPDYCLIRGSTIINIKLKAYQCGFRVLRSLTIARMKGLSIYMATPVLRKE